MITNKTIVLTGASSGIGLEVLKILSKGEGNVILAVSRHAEQKLMDFAPNVIPFNADISNKEGVDSIFARAEELFTKIDIYYNNAGFPYYERFDYEDWDRLRAIFDTNTISPAYTYVKYRNHLNGRDGHLCFTISAIGTMAMPGYALYSASKFGLEGFQQGIRLEMPKNMKFTCLYPVATNTNFFKVAADGAEFEKPFPVQDPKVVAEKMVAGIEAGKKRVSPSMLFGLSKVLMTIIPAVRTIYWYLEQQKLVRFIKKTKHEDLFPKIKKLHADLRDNISEVKVNLADVKAEMRANLENAKADMRANIEDAKANLSDIRAGIKDKI